MKKIIIKSKHNFRETIDKINNFDFKKVNYKHIFMSEIKKIIQDFKTFDYKLYIKTNKLFLTTIIGLLINATLLRIFTVKNYFDIKPIIGDITVLLLFGSFAYFLKPKKQFIYFISMSIIFTTICIINSVYYTFYTSFASFSLLMTAFQIVDVGDAVVKNVLEIKDFVFIWQPITLILLHIGLVRNDYYQFVLKIERRSKRFRGTLIVSLFTLAIFSLSLTSIEIGRLVKQWNREFLVMKYGVYIYQLNDVVKSLEPSINSVFGYDEAVKKIREFYATKKTPATNKYTNVFKDKNIIFIHAESIQQFTMDLKFNNQEVTPNLNKLAKSGLYFSNFYSQVSVGTSSDTEFTLLTSLLPVSNGTVFVSYFDRQYVATPQLLKAQGYYTFSMHGNNGNFWNRSVMHKNLGYEKFYSKSSYIIDETIGLGLSDKSFFKQSIPIINNISQNNPKFFGTMIMLSNHTPFDDVEKYGEFPVDMKYQDPITGQILSAPYMEDTTLGNYFKSVHYADSAIGEFINGLDQEGLLENTVVVIYGDHDARLSKSDYTRLYNYDPTTNSILNRDNPNYKAVDYYQYELNRKVPFIIWTKNGKYQEEIKEVMGMYDVLPTLGNMVGFNSPYSLGNDIFSGNNNIVVFPNGNWLTNKVYFNNQKEEYQQLTQEPLTTDYITSNSTYAETIVEVSNDIIKYDYIKKESEQSVASITNNNK